MEASGVVIMSSDRLHFSHGLAEYADCPNPAISQQIMIGFIY